MRKSWSPRRKWWTAAAVVVTLIVAWGVVIVRPPALEAGVIPPADTFAMAAVEKADLGAEAGPQGMLAGAIAKLGGQTTYGWGNGLTQAFTGDFNADGKWDIGVTATADDKERCWYIRYGNGKGSFAGDTKYCWGNGVTNAFAGDFNGDGKWDIGVTGTDAQSDRNWYIRYGDGKGNFGNETKYWWGNGVTNIFTGDFNGDGKWDIGVTGNEKQPNERTWYIRYGDGRGNFGNQTAYWWGNGLTNVFTGDFNGDGKWDIGVTGTATQRERVWYIRYGFGNGQFANTDDTYAWGNGVTNVFTGDFNGDRLWDIGVTGTRAQSDRNWYIRYNEMKKGSTGGGTTTPPQPDPKLQKADEMARLAYERLLGRQATAAERQQWVDKVKAGASLEDVWTGVARSQERVTRYGFWAPAEVSYNGKTEQCFGAVGSKCDGVPVATPDVKWVDKFVRPDGVEMGYIQIMVVVGSILHDNACLDNSAGQYCNGLLPGFLTDLVSIKPLIPASQEWNKAVYNVRDSRGWIDRFGPYPTDAGKRAKWSDDLTRTDARASLMAKVLPYFVSIPVTTDPYRGKETRQTRALKAPATAAVDRGDAAYCASGQYKEEGRWWTAQWWGTCK